MSDLSRFYEIGLARGREGESSPVGLFDFPNQEEERAAQRGWEAGQAAREHAEAVTEALAAHEDEDTSQSYDSSSSSSSDATFVFPSSVVSACHKNGYRVIDSDSKRVCFEATAAGGTRRVYVYIYGKTLEFTVRSKFVFLSEDSIPIGLSVSALKKSADLKNSFWCIERVNGEYVFEIMANMFQERFDAEWLEIKSRNLVKHCAELEAKH